jgi:protein-disulfide isomerase
MSDKKKILLTYVMVVGAAVSITFGLQHLYPVAYVSLAKLYETYERQKVKSLIQARHDEVYSDSAHPVIGNSQAKTTIVEFFDYRCGHCRNSALWFDRVLSANPQVRVILRDFPIFGDDSEYAARLGLAAGRHGKYLEFYRGVFLRDKSISARKDFDQVVTDIGLDINAIRAESQDSSVTETINRNKALGKQLLINGTPGFVIGDRVVLGELSEDQLKRAQSGSTQLVSLASHQ